MSTLTTKTVDELEVAGPFSGTDITLISQGGSTLKRSPLQNLLDWLTAHFVLASINDAGDVNTAGKTTDQILTWNGTQWVPADAPITGATQLDELTDVDLTTPPTEGQALVFDADDGQWKPGSVATGGGGGVVTMIPALIGCMAKKSADLENTDFSTAAVVSWDAETYDTNGFHSTGTNPERITIPAGLDYTKARLTASLGFLSVGSNITVIMQIRKNGSMDYDGVAAVNTNVGLASSAQVSCSTPVLEVEDGDYFEVYLQILGDVSVTLDASRSTFSLQMVEAGTPAPVNSLANLTDVDVTGVATGEHLEFDGTNWVPVGPAAVPSTLNDLSDVDTTGVNTGDRLAFNGTNWVDEKPHGTLPTQTITASGALSINRASGEVARVSLAGNVTSFSVTGWPATGNLGRLVLEISNTGAFNITSWPTGTIWAGGNSPTITSGLGKKDLVILTTFNGGTTIYGALAGQDFS
jgi:hypothetical protein